MRFLCFLSVSVALLISCSPSGDSGREDFGRIDEEALKAYEALMEFEKKIDKKDPERLRELIKRYEETWKKMEGSQYVDKMAELQRRHAKLKGELSRNIYEASYKKMEELQQRARLLILRGDYTGALNELGKFPSEFEGTEAHTAIESDKRMLKSINSLPEEVRSVAKEISDLGMDMNYNRAYEKVAQYLPSYTDKAHSAGMEGDEENRKLWAMAKRLILTIGVAVLDKEMSGYIEDGDYDKALDRCDYLRSLSAFREGKSIMGRFIDGWAVKALNLKMNRMEVAGDYEKALEFLRRLKRRQGFYYIRANIEQWEEKIKAKAGK